MATISSGASHRYNALGDRTLSVGVLYATEVKFGSCAHYIGTGGGAHCPLIKGITPDQGMRGGLGPLWPSPLEINSNNISLLVFPASLVHRRMPPPR
jgi:hypothetical protein